MLARRAAAEVPPGEEDRGATELGPVELEPGPLVAVLVEAPVVEQELAVARALDPLQELLRDDLVGVDVGSVEDRDRPCTFRSGFMRRRAPLEGADVDEAAVERRGRGHLRADEVRAAATPLAPFEVAVRGRGAALAGREDVRVHAEAHRAARKPPLEAGVQEDAVESSSSA